MVPTYLTYAPMCHKKHQLWLDLKSQVINKKIKKEEELTRTDSTEDLFLYLPQKIIKSNTFSIIKIKSFSGVLNWL